MNAWLGMGMRFGVRLHMPIQEPPPNEFWILWWIRLGIRLETPIQQPPPVSSGFDWGFD